MRRLWVVVALVAGVIIVPAARSIAAPARLADFNGDGISDLAVGDPFEDVGTASQAGAVNVLYGSATGLTDDGAQSWSRDTSGVKGNAQAMGHFGYSLAAGDLNGDGKADLAIGAPNETVGTVAGAGTVNVLYGSHKGLTTT